MKITRRDVGLTAVTFATGVGAILAAFLVQPDTAPGLRDALARSAGLWFFLGVFAVLETVVLWALYGSLRALSLVIALGLLVAASWWVGAQLFG
jgi:hypothetical protein